MVIVNISKLVVHKKQLDKTQADDGGACLLINKRYWKKRLNLNGGIISIFWSWLFFLITSKLQVKKLAHYYYNCNYLQSSTYSASLFECAWICIKNIAKLNQLCSLWSNTACWLVNSVRQTQTNNWQQTPNLIVLQ